MSKFVNINGVWRSSLDQYTNIGGIWKRASTEHVNINGVWRSSGTPFDSFLQFISSGISGASLEVNSNKIIVRLPKGTTSCWAGFKIKYDYPNQGAGWWDSLSISGSIKSDGSTDSNRMFKFKCKGTDEQEFSEYANTRTTWSSCTFYNPTEFKIYANPNYTTTWEITKLVQNGRGSYRFAFPLGAEY